MTTKRNTTTAKSNRAMKNSFTGYEKISNSFRSHIANPDVSDTAVTSYLIRYFLRFSIVKDIDASRKTN